MARSNSAKTPHLEHGLACRSGRIDCLLMQVQIAVKGLKLVQKLDQVLKTAAKPINGPRRNHVDTPRCGVLQQSVQAGALQCTAVNSLLTDSRSLFTRLGLFLFDPLRR
jgi:hypothetical protein